MNEYNLTFHHLGLAVTQKEKAIRFIKGLGYEIGEEVYDPLQKVNLIMCQSEVMPHIEIITRSHEPGPLEAILKDRTELIYHVCFSTSDLESSLNSIKAQGHRILCISPPKPAVLFPKSDVSFYLVNGFGLIEIIRTLK